MYGFFLFGECGGGNGALLLVGFGSDSRRG